MFWICLTPITAWIGPMKNKSLIAIVVFIWTFNLKADETNQVVVGVATTLTGDAATFGKEIVNALNFANKKFLNNKFRFIFEDDQCNAKGAITAAQKLSSIDQVKYVLGPACNEALLAAAPVYQAKKVLVITPYATSGDVEDVGDHIFRTFPSDVAAAELLYKYVAARHKRFSVYSEQNEYPILMERTFKKINSKNANLLNISYENWNPGNYDHKSTLLKLISKKPEGFFVNANAEASLVEVVKQLRALKYKGQIYSVYYAASEISIQALGEMAEGITIANTPQLDSLLNVEGQKIFSEYVREYGSPVSANLLTALSIDSVKLLDAAINSGMAPHEYLKERQFDSMIGRIGFDKFGAIQGINFEMQKIVKGKVVKIPN